jgi:alpha,alpha-trehalase
LPSALAEAARLLPRTTGHHTCVFLDYDGTLTPIVARPEDARLDELTRCVLSDLAHRVPVTIVSGRDLRDVRALVAVDGLHYAGSHGFEIQAPDGRRIDAGPGDAFLPALDRAEADLRDALEGLAGAQVDRKRFTVAVHYRNVREGEVPRVVAAVDAVAAVHPELGRAEGKKVFELRPRIQWDKGHAVALLVEVLGCDPARDVLVYVGDDLTDEDAFRAVAPRGLAIVVSDEPRPTCARYRLRDPSEVRTFLEALREVVAGEARS